LNVGISFGVAELQPEDNYIKALQRADKAMCQMKKAKKSNV